MRYVVMLMLLVPVSCRAAANCFAHTSTYGTLTSPSMNTTGATLLVAAVSTYAGYNQVLIDTVGTRDWSSTQVYDAFGSANLWSLVLYKVNPVTSTSYAFSIPSQAGMVLGGSFTSATVWACSGTATDIYVMTAQTGLPTSGTNTNWQPGSLTPHEAGDLLFTAGLNNTNGVTASIGSGYSTPVIYDVAGQEVTVSAWQSATSTAAVNPTWTTNQPSWTGIQVLFRAAGVSAPTGSGGTIQNLAGTGLQGFAGDGGLATNAYLQLPGQIVRTSAGLVCFADVYNERIRCSNPTGASITQYGQTIAAGNVMTVAGSGTLGFADGALLSANFGHPVGLAIDSADCMYVADQQNHAIRKFCTTGGVTTVAGRGSAGVDGNGCFTPGATNGFSGSSGDGGPATSALLFCPQGVAVDASGNIVIADSNNYRIRVVNTQSTTQTLWGKSICPGCIQTVLGTTAGNCVVANSIGGPLGLRVEASGSIISTAYLCNQIVRLSTSGVESFPVGTGTAGYAGDGGPATSAQLNAPFDVVEDASGNMYIADTVNSVIRYVDHTSGNISTVAGNYNVYPFNGSTYWGSGGYCCDTGYATLAGMINPIGLYIRASTLYITDGGNNRIRSMNIGSTGALTLTPTSFNFGNQLVSTSSSPQSFTLTNGTTSTVTSVIVSITGTYGADYSQTNTCSTSLANGASCSINVTFTPFASGLRPAALTVTSTMPRQTSSLTGNGTTLGGTKIQSGTRWQSGVVVK